ncbi:hypothetical protein JCGZ_02806 [Jatropha curcas]|uniref:Enoyl reductase (ER) domain-containing protein n=1 Tax=Jatropha curcas TaxID=180498 RepID=A0A067L541_JATCU|nr:2-alkenal reductase (NADP(+)-dependent) [Jatropha curcas]KDP42333.1 hypothetical protein JCGZ_02806 [Jatropha curcas]
MGSISEQTVSNKQVILKEYANKGCPKESNLLVSTNFIKLKVPEGTDGVLVKNLYLSCDPYIRILLREEREPNHPFDPFELGSVINGLGVGKVVESGHPDFKKGEFVWGMTGWEEYTLIPTPTQSLVKIHNTDLPLSYHAGILGMTGMTAYVGLYEIGAPKKGDYVFVSAAAGATGHLVGQFAKLAGCYVVGSAGSKEKVDLLKNKFGFDEAFNYNEEKDLEAAFKRYFPEGIDIYFDNVAGKMLDAVLLNMRHEGRVVMCGATSHYTSDKIHCGIFNTNQVILKSIHMKGYIVSDYYHLLPKYLEMVIPKLKQGKIVYAEDIAVGLESAPAAFVGLFRGHNVGKQVIKIANE